MAMMKPALLLLLGAALAVRAQVTCKVASVNGCYPDFTDQATRLLTIGPITITSQETCAAACNNLGLPLAGVEFGTQCFCDSALNPAANKTQAPMTDCQVMKCTGSPSEACGNADRILVFTYQCSGTPIPNYQGCIDPSATALPYCNTKLTYEQRVEDLIGRLTLEEKIAIIAPQPALGDVCEVHVAGVPSIGLPPYSYLVETNTGVASSCLSQEKCVTTFNGPMGMGASFNRTSWYLKGSVLGTEMRAMRNLNWHRGDVNDPIGLTGYGPNINIARDPRFGRSSELPGEDPFLSGTYASNMVSGMQEKDAAGHPKMLAYLKHFTAYSRETDRGHDTYNISMHDLFETYLAQYEIAFTEGQATGAMCSYNAINGHPSCANGYILNTVIRGMWNRTDAHITTDCGAVQNLLGDPVNAASPAIAAAMAINNGTDVEMGSTVWTYHLQEAISKGLTTEAAVNISLRRTMLPQFIAGRFDPLESSEWNSIGIESINSSDHRQIQFEAALQSFVLLKNDGILPLPTGKSIAVLGPMGETRAGLLEDYSGDQICFNDYDCIPTIAEAIITANAGGVTTNTTGVDINSNSTADIPHALALAQAADIVILVMGIDKTQEHEGIDRTDTALPGEQEPFVLQVLALKKPTILILSNGGALAIDNLVAGPNAIIESFNPAVLGPTALAQTIFGLHNRWGKLPVTMYPHNYILQQDMTNFDMAKPPGRTYKYYSGTPLWPFGFGMSYTTFNMSCVSQNPKYSFSCTVENIGSFDGDEVVMAYHSAGADVRAQANHPVPIKQLRDFGRVTVSRGQSETLKFSFSLDAFMLVNANGVKTLYHGTHQIIFSRGVGTDVVFTLTL